MRRYLFILLFLVVVTPATSNAREIVGWVEKARIFPGNLEVRSRVDTGAKTSSLGVEYVEHFKRGEEDWVRFSATSYKGKTIWLERKLVRNVRVKRDHGTIRERPVILMGVCLGDRYEEVEVSLEDRSHMNYQMLIGRNFLDSHFFVDPGAVYINSPRCKQDSVIKHQE
jgi:hypothetical protein